jgi:hypothetical protein
LTNSLFVPGLSGKENLKLSEQIKTRRRTPEQRARIAEATKAAMADPAVREKVSRRTIEGLRNAASQLEPEWQQLRQAWGIARPAVRKRFLDEVLIEPVLR